MKASKDGKVILTRNDRRVGNFVYSDYADRVAFTDINGTVRTGVSKRTLAGRMVSDAIRRGADSFLHNYAAALYYLNGLAPDREFLEDVVRAAGACVGRHPELYGARDVPEGEQEGIVREVEELRRFEDEAKAAPGRPE